nr:MAG TPA: hypothetical protein [Bacteriophage sp.]
MALCPYVFETYIMSKPYNHIISPIYRKEHPL